MTVGERIKLRREELQLTQEDLAIRLGVKDKSSVSKIEAAGDIISTKNVTKYADALCCTPSYLMGWDDIAPSDNLYSFAKQTVLINELNSLIDKLNDDGIKKLIERAEELNEVARYKK